MVKNSPVSAGGRFDPWVGKNTWRRKWQTTLVFFPGKSHGHRSLEGYSPWGHKRVGHDSATKQRQRKKEKQMLPGHFSHLVCSKTALDSKKHTSFLTIL